MYYFSNVIYGSINILCEIDSPCAILPCNIIILFHSLQFTNELSMGVRLSTKCTSHANKTLLNLNIRKVNPRPTIYFGFEYKQ